MKSKLFLAKFAASLTLMSAVGPSWAQDNTLSSEADTASVAAGTETVPSDVTAEAELPPENPADWQYQTTLSLPAEEVPEAANLLDTFVPADVFRHSSYDLSDLRLNADDGSSVPYAVRTLSARDVMEYLPASEFNRSEPEDGVHEVTLEFSTNEPTHNQVVIETSGEEFRRSIVIEGSDDGKDWKNLAKGHLLNLTAEGKSLIQKTFRYRESRHRFLRIQVSPDPQVMTSESGKMNSRSTQCRLHDKFPFLLCWLQLMLRLVHASQLGSTAHRVLAGSWTLEPRFPLIDWKSRSKIRSLSETSVWRRRP